MTAFVWIALGLSASASLLHAALGLRRPFYYQHLAFSAVMALLAIALVCDVGVSRSDSLAAAAPWTRAGTLFAVGLLASYGWFLRAYARIEVPRALVSLFGIGLVCIAAYAAVSPYGITIGADPRFVGLPQQAGRSLHVIVSDPGPVQFIYAAFVAVVVSAGAVAGMQLYRRGQRWQGVLLCAAVSPVVLAIGFDVGSDLVGAPRLELTEASATALALSMSFQLATEFRVSEQRLRPTLHGVERRTTELAAAVGASLVVRDKLNTPLQTLELGLAMLPQHTSNDRNQLAALERALARIIELGRAVELAAHRDPSSPAHEERPP
jgi:hypothetical protein